MLWKWSAVTFWPVRNPLVKFYQAPITLAHNLNSLPDLHKHILLLDGSVPFYIHLKSYLKSQVTQITKIYLHFMNQDYSLWRRYRKRLFSLSRTHLLSVSASFYHGTGFEESLGLEIPINSAQWWDLSGFAPSPINNLFLNHILQHLTVWQNISHFSITALHDIQWDTCEYHLRSMYLRHKAIIGLIRSIMKARCCWIWRLSIYGAVLSETSATCTSKSWGVLCLCNTCLSLTAPINRASWTVAVKAKGICEATGAEPTKWTNAQWRHTIKE